MGFKPIKVQIEGRLIPSLVEKLNISFKEAQKIVDRKRVRVNGKIFTDKKATLKEEIEVIHFIPESTGLRPIFENSKFAIFDKPFNLPVHPNNLSPSKTLLDDVRYLFGKEANSVHRLDKETSGLIVASKDKITEIELKKMFIDKKVQKYYLALVKGNIKKPIIINKPILANRDMDIKVKVLIDERGKEAITHITPIKTIGDNTLVIAKPITGRQHQIRVHLFSIGHPIVGEPIYGVDFEIADRYLKGELSENDRLKYIGHHRLMLHSYKIDFEYQGIKYKIYSNSHSFDKMDKI